MVINKTMKLAQLITEENVYTNEHYIDVSDRLREVLAAHRKSNRGLHDTLVDFVMKEKEYSYAEGYEDGKFHPKGT